jgi:hypothetical protein
VTRTYLHPLSGATFSLDRPARSVREVLERRGLPAGRFVRLWGGSGSQCSCEACERIIEPDEVEYELEFSDGTQSITLRLHRECWENWSLEETEP